MIRVGEVDEAIGDFHSDFQTFSNAVFIILKHGKMLITSKAG